MTDMRPFFEYVQGIYDDDHDLSLLELFLDPQLVYSCAYFERDDMTLAEAQVAKLDLSLGKVNLQPGETLLDIGCGYGGLLCRAAEKHGVNGIGLTLSEVQAAFCKKRAEAMPEGSPNLEFRVQGWEEFDQPVDKIISIGAFEHFRKERYKQFFDRCYGILPAAGRMMLHTIVMYDLRNVEKKGLKVDHEAVLFTKFIAKEIFPGGQLVDPETIIQYAEASGFKVEKVQHLGQHYARTLRNWATNLEAHKEEAIKRKSQEVYDRYMKYLLGCAKYFTSGHIDLCQFTLVK